MMRMMIKMRQHQQQSLQNENPPVITGIHNASVCGSLLHDHKFLPAQYAWCLARWCADLPTQQTSLVIFFDQLNVWN